VGKGTPPGKNEDEFAQFYSKLSRRGNCFAKKNEEERMRGMRSVDFADRNDEAESGTARPAGRGEAVFIEQVYDESPGSQEGAPG
jgi:hypothetical protein